MCEFSIWNNRNWVIPKRNRFKINYITDKINRHFNGLIEHSNIEYKETVKFCVNFDKIPNFRSYRNEENK